MANLKSFAAVALLLSACTNPMAAPPPPIATVQQGDSQLSCDEITSQMADMDGAMAPPVTDAAYTSAGASTAATTALSFIPVVGGFIGAGVGMASANNSASSMGAQFNHQQQARERKARLISLYDRKRCR